MKLILADAVNKTKWDELVRTSGGTVFSLSTYLDATADNWAVLFNDDLSGGITCPFAVKAGVKVLYAPFFHRYIEWIGANRPSDELLLQQLQELFPVADVNCRMIDRGSEKVHQELTQDQYNPNQQAKRMLKKTGVFHISEEWLPEQLMQLLETELVPRIAGIDAHSLSKLQRLVTDFEQKGMIQINLWKENDWQGGLWLLVFENRALYLKGTVTADAKKSGGMYRLMEYAIQQAFSTNKLVDFGGSNAEGVRRFNLNWGATDRSYQHLQWNNAPLWWKTVKSLRDKWNNKSFS
ncbi:MAG: hypothetical protein A3D31_19130 [Candidatus Fluviicola riflensis]|nr:MAG: hypothetical protein CHH17_05855 [Candidatus Fluviicola riflensis]OGS75902.1 MAG: hypothetical protein A3D31_19130 [Candidatus Fluviicola riflensis]OGS83582.1 MAG: hypothetical protein A2724_19145 [Fluviicola sp. RIFCSPHIGHO2_01_FULL_43_53]OGS85721.1 MAG: hypothetical protein A3E30_18675 [Fluviicola sp. RIFCSPHIGHO2_12_FULL_43_24]